VEEKERRPTCRKKLSLREEVEQFLLGERGGHQELDEKGNAENLRSGENAAASRQQPFPGGFSPKEGPNPPETVGKPSSLRGLHLHRKRKVLSWGRGKLNAWKKNCRTRVLAPVFMEGREKPFQNAWKGHGKVSSCSSEGSPIPRELRKNEKRGEGDIRREKKKHLVERNSLRKTRPQKKGPQNRSLGP